MMDMPVYNMSGQEVARFQVDEELLGGTVRPALLKQALVMYHANKRQGTVATRSRAEVEGSTKKLYAQKHTGNARRGNIRTNVMKGGGNAFAKKPREFRQDMPVKQRRLARNNALLAKFISKNVRILDSVTIDRPHTKTVSGMLAALEANRSVLIGTHGADRNFYLSARNLARTNIMPARQMSAYDILSSRMLVITKPALEELLQLAGEMRKKPRAATEQAA